MRKYEEMSKENKDKLYQQAYEVFKEKDNLIQKAHNLFAIIQNPDFVCSDDIKLYQNNKDNFINYTYMLCDNIEIIAKRLADINEQQENRN